MDSQGLVVYVADSHDDCIQLFLISGQFLLEFAIGHQGLWSGELCTPDGIAIHDKDYVHICEPALQRVSVFTSTRKFVWCFEVCDKDEDSDTEKKHTPKLTALAFDKSGKFYDCMPAKGQVVIL